MEPDVNAQIQAGIDRFKADAKKKSAEFRAFIIGLVTLIGGGMTLGFPIGMLVTRARVVEKEVEKVIKVPVPAPAPKLGPFRTVCPRCGAALLLFPPTPGQTGSLPPGPDLKDSLDEHFDEGPRRHPDAAHPGGVAPGGSPALQHKAPPRRPNPIGPGPVARAPA